uniref:Uncharacterized protein n=1 Tax=Oryza meridionalis TaxID=40149 RepID=A0A0E0DJA4_9ORYZ
MVELFLSRGVDVDLDSITGTPLLTTAMNGQYSTMKILLEHHADVRHQFFLLLPHLCKRNA